MIYCKVEQALVKTKQILHFYNTHFSVEMTSKAENISQKHTFTQIDHQPQLPGTLFYLTRLSWNGMHRIHALKNRSDEGISGDRK